MSATVVSNALHLNMLKIEGEADLTFSCLQTNVEFHVFKLNSKFLRKAIHFAECILKTHSNMGTLLSSNNKQCTTRPSILYVTQKRAFMPFILYWVSKVLVCLYILEKVEIWSGVTDA